jgi:uncharacterized protein (DUF302 family)
VDDPRFEKTQMTTPMPTEISVRTTLPFEECLGLLRQKLQRERFRVVAELQIDREFENRLGVHWRKSTVLVVWDSFYAYQALLCGANGALFLPFNISVSDEAGSTLIATMNHSADGFGQGFIGCPDSDARTQPQDGASPHGICRSRHRGYWVQLYRSDRRRPYDSSAKQQWESAAAQNRFMAIANGGGRLDRFVGAHSIAYGPNLDSGSSSQRAGAPLDPCVHLSHVGTAPEGQCLVQGERRDLDHAPNC